MEDFDAIRRKLDAEYQRTLKDLSEAQANSEEAQWQLKKLSELHKQRMSEAESYQKDYEAVRTANRDIEDRKEKKKDRIVRIIVDGAAILLPLGFSGYWMAKGMKFEETGTYTSRTGNWIKNHLGLFKSK